MLPYGLRSQNLQHLQEEQGEGICKKCNKNYPCALNVFSYIYDYRNQILQTS